LHFREVSRTINREENNNRVLVFCINIILSVNCTFSPLWLYCSKVVLSAAILKVRTEEVAELVLVATHPEGRNKVGMNLQCILHSELSVI
jgi:hypothetical protein